jgi:CSLREA domain-containing protein
MRRRFPCLLGAITALAAIGSSPATAATIAPTTLADELNADGDCSLREAVASANTNTSVDGCEKGQGAKRDTIKLAPGELYTLTIASTNEDENLNGDLDFTGGGPVTLRGNSRGMGGPLVEAGANDRALDAPQGAGSLVVKRLNLEGGNVTGLAGGDDVGGAIRSEGRPLTVEDVNVEHGIARMGGGIHAEDGPRLAIAGSFMGQNWATGNGGAIEALGVKSLVVKRSGLDSNDAIGTSPRGGAIHTTAETTQVVDSEVTFNNAQTLLPGGSAEGGGIYSTSGDLVIRRSLIQSNDVDDTGGISLSRGGGVRSPDGKVKVVNSTVFGNAVDGDGGGLFVARGSIAHSTFLNNTAGDSGDHLASTGAATPVALRNSILPGADGVVDLCGGDPGSFVSKGYSVAQFDDPICGTLDSDAIVPSVGLADAVPMNNGGETLTLAIAGTSPAKNLIPKRKCRSAEGTDQRRYQRPRRKRCDAGAFERGAKPN